MRDSLELILSLLDRQEPAYVSREDWESRQGDALRIGQKLGFVDREPGMSPTPSCPHCGEGVPYPIGEQYRCGSCCSAVDRSHLFLWRIWHQRFLEWIAAEWGLRGGVQRIDGWLWQLGTWRRKDRTVECFFRGRGPLSEQARKRLLAFRSAAVILPVTREVDIAGFHGSAVSLLEALHQTARALKVRDLGELLDGRRTVRFDTDDGSLWAGGVFLGAVTPFSKEYCLLQILSERQGQLVSYAEMKRDVLHRSGGTDATEEATFCQKLKSRIKKKRWVSQIDRVIVTTNKGEGYLMRSTIPG